MTFSFRSPGCRLSGATLTISLLIALPGAMGQDEGPSKPAAGKSAAVNTDPLGAGGAMEGAFDLFPVGKPWLEVRVPRYNDRDELASMMHSETLTRETAQLLELDGLTLATFQPDGKMTLRVKTARGYYNLENAQLRSRTKTYIEHQQFDMQGDSMVFDTETGKGTLNGNVEMVIYNMGAGTMPFPGAASSSGG